jgi:hypothetical protein
MNEMFRYRKSLQFEAVASLLFCLTLTVWFASDFFLKDPESHGFKNKHSMVTLTCFGIAVFGTMGLLSGYLLAAYYVEFLSIDDDAIVVRSVFRQRRRKY